MAAKELDLLAQALGQRDVAAVLPEWAVALRLAVMQQQKIAHAGELRLEHPVVSVDIGGRKIPVRKELEQHGNATLDEMDRCRLERLEEPGGQAQGHHVPVPGGLAPPGPEAQRRRLAQGAAGKVAQQQRSARHRRR